MSLGLNMSYFSKFLWSVSAVSLEAIQVWKRLIVQVLYTSWKMSGYYLQLLNYLSRNEKNLKFTFLQFSDKFYNSYFFQVLFNNQGNSRNVLTFESQFLIIKSSILYLSKLNLKHFKILNLIQIL